MQIKLDSGAYMPGRSHPSDAGLDIRGIDSYSIYPGEVKKIHTGVSIKIPVGKVGMVFPRSSIGKKGLTLANTVGIIDSDYRGEIMLLMKNNTTEILNTAAGERLAQIVILPIELPKLEIFEGEESDWVDTKRGTGGFGSTGVA